MLVAIGCRGVPTSTPPSVTSRSTLPAPATTVRGQDDDAPAGVAISSRASRGYYADDVPADSPFAPAPVAPQYSAPAAPQYQYPAPVAVSPPIVSPPALPASSSPWDFVGTPETVPSPMSPTVSLMPSPWDAHTPGNTAGPLQVSESGWANLAATSGRGVSIDEAAKNDEMARERARLVELARQSQGGNVKEKHYLDPLVDWAGPFAQRRDREASPTLVASTSDVGYIEPYQSGTEGEGELFEWEKEEKKSFDWDILDPVNFFKSVRDWAGMGPDEAKANALMVRGREILLSNPDLADVKKNAEAAKLFEQAAKRWPDSLLAEEALFLAAECRFFADDYPQAMLNYHSLISKYHHSKWVNASVRRLFAIARYWERESLKTHAPINIADKSRPWADTFGNAKKAYEAIFISDPNGPISDDAVMALASAYLARGLKQGDHAFSMAAYYYGYLRENFPNSRHVPKATEMELLARINAYNGGDYDGKSLQEASSLANSAIRNREGETDIQEIGAIKETVTEKQAERDWVMAQYYERKRYYGASRMYYNKILTNYAQTVYAGQARNRLAAIAAYPDEPPGYIERAKRMLTFQR